jgi:signal transduction histidine kinase
VTQADTVPVAVDDVVAARLAAWRAPAAAAGVALVRESPSGPGPPEPGVDRIVRTMPGVLDQVLDALLDNAVKFAHGTRVAVRVVHRDGQVEIHVADDGPGLPDADRVRATERFWRSRAHRKEPGTGLGLAIVAVLVEASGGTLELLPVEPHGLDVRLRLPTSAADGASLPASRVGQRFTSR